VTSKNGTVATGLNSENDAVTPTVIGYRLRLLISNSIEKNLTVNEAHLIEPEIGNPALKLSETRPLQACAHVPDLVDLGSNLQIAGADQLFTNVRPARVGWLDSLAIFYKIFIGQVAKSENATKLVFVVPACYTQHQRAMFQQALCCVGDGENSVVDDMDAIGYADANDRWSEFIRRPQHELFVDIRRTSVRSFLLKFSTISTETKRSTVDRLAYEVEKLQRASKSHTRLRLKPPLDQLTPAEKQARVASLRRDNNRLKKEIARVDFMIYGKAGQYQEWKTIA
jgi:hypothetical protein